MPPLVPLIVAWVAGLVSAHHWLTPARVEPVVLLLLAILPLAAALLWWRDRRMRMGALLTLAFLLGGLRYVAHVDQVQSENSVSLYNDSGWVMLEGVVRDHPVVRDTWMDLTLDAQTLELGDERHTVRGPVLVHAPRYPHYQFGDQLRVSGKLLTPVDRDGSSYSTRLALQSIFSEIWYPQVQTLVPGTQKGVRPTLFALRDQARDTVAALTADPEASLLQGILLGARSGIPQDLNEAFRATGTSHIVVVSGANMTIIATLLAVTLGRLLGRRMAYWLTLFGILVYMALVGADAVVVRAGMMGGLYVTALYLGRRATAYVSLLVSCLLLTALNPLTLWDVGFQLSIAATMGLILFSARFAHGLEDGQRKLWRGAADLTQRGALGYLNEVLSVTLAAQILVVPLLIYHFGRVPLVAPLANLLIVPVQPIIMVVGGIATAVGLVPPLQPLAEAVAWVPWLLLAYTKAVVTQMADWPLASVAASRGTAGSLVAIGGALGISIWAWRQGRAAAFRRLLARAWHMPKIAIGAPLIMAILVWLAVVQLPDGRLHVAFLDVGQGDAVLITTPLGHQILIDGGPSPAALTAALGQAMPFWDRSLDLVVMTHPDSDHISGLAEVVTRFRVEGWLDSGLSGSDPVYTECLRRLQARQVSHLIAASGTRMDLGTGAVLEVLHPSARTRVAGSGPALSVEGPEEDANDQSLVLRLIWGQAEFLFTGDLEAAGEQVLVESGQDLHADVLKVGHHGAATSSTRQFLSAVKPHWAIISVGEGNRFGHPHAEVLQRLAESKAITLLRTDERGTIELVSDGQRMWTRTQR